jgi:hypothetical protein
MNDIDKCGSYVQNWSFLTELLTGWSSELGAEIVWPLPQVQTLMLFSLSLLGKLGLYQAADDK